MYIYMHIYIYRCIYHAVPSPMSPKPYTTRPKLQTSNCKLSTIRAPKPLG